MAELSDVGEMDHLMDPERTPEGSNLRCDDLDLWKKVEEERGQRSWDRYNKLREGREAREAAEPAPRRAERAERILSERSDRRRECKADKAESEQISSEGKGLEDLWQKAEAELQRRRAQAANRGLRVYDMAKGKGREGLGKGSERYERYERSGYPSKTVQSSWQGSLQLEGDGRQYKVLLSRRNLDDVALQHWCRWARPKLARLPSSAVVILIDLGFNKITAQGLQLLLDMLQELEVPVEALSLHHNLLADEAADALAQYLQHSSHTLFELSLTNNQIGEPGARTLLEAAVRAMQSPSELEQSGTNAVRYPALRQNKKVPLWLRLGYNRIGEGRPGFIRNFLKRTEAELQKIRQGLGTASESPEEDPWASFAGLRAGGTRVPDSSTHIFCEALSGLGCDQKCCTQLYPEVNGFPAGPAVHLFQLDQQLERESSLSWQQPRPLRRHEEGKGQKGHKGQKGERGGKGKPGKFLDNFKAPSRSDGSEEHPREGREEPESRLDDKELRSLFDLSAAHEGLSSALCLLEHHGGLRL